MKAKALVDQLDVRLPLDAFDKCHPQMLEDYHSALLEYRRANRRQGTVLGIGRKYKPTQGQIDAERIAALEINRALIVLKRSYANIVAECQLARKSS